MRASQDQGVHARVLQRCQVLAGHGFDLLTRSHPGLDELDESRARLLAHGQTGNGGERAQVRLGLDGRLRTDHADVMVARGDDALARRRRDDLNDGDASVDPIALARVRERGGRGRVAGNDQGLDSARGQLVEGGQGQRAHLRDRTRTVGRVLGVAQVDDLFVGQLIDDRTGYRQPTQARVEDSDRGVIHVLDLIPY